MAKIESLFCFCGGNVCVCQMAKGCGWRAHCQDCDWSYGGSTLSMNKRKVIAEWKRITKLFHKVKKNV